MSFWDWLKNWWHPEPPAPPVPPLTTGLVVAVNRVRVAHGLPELTENAILAGTAAAQAGYCASLGRLTHVGPNGSTVHSRTAAAGYLGVLGGSVNEVIAAGQQTPREAVQVWLADQPHAEIILSRAYTEAGGAVATGQDGMPYWCLDVGSPT